MSEHRSQPLRLDAAGADLVRARRRHLRRQRAQIERQLDELFSGLGLDVSSAGARDTSNRFLDALFEMTAGYEGDDNATTTFPDEWLHGADASAPVIEGPIAFHSLCEHHALPFFGDVNVGYVPGDRIVGISKLTRIVRLYAHRFSVQERLGEEIAEAVDNVTGGTGVAVRVEAVHLCTRMRGVRETESTTRTLAWRGAFRDRADLRELFLAEVQDR